jgi:hypothetical protein
MEAIIFYETLLNLIRATHLHISKEIHPHAYFCENLRCNTLYIIFLVIFVVVTTNVYKTANQY